MDVKISNPLRNAFRTLADNSTFFYLTYIYANKAMR